MQKRKERQERKIDCIFYNVKITTFIFIKKLDKMYVPNMFIKLYKAKKR